MFGSPQMAFRSQDGCASFRALVVSALLLATLAPAASAVQTQAMWGEPAPIFGTRDAVLLAGLVALHAALIPFDGDLRREVREMDGAAADALARTVEPIGGSSYWLQGSAGAFVVGKVFGANRVADLGLHAFLSIALSNTVTGGLKGLSGRSRPNAALTVDEGTDLFHHDPHAWRLLGGWGEADRRSYPSNHATTAFAVATVLSEELGGVTPWLAYPIAGLVAWSRLHDDAHWASDVTLGAAVGIFSARLVVRSFHRQNPGPERWLLLETDPLDRAFRFGARVSMGGTR